MGRVSLPKSFANTSVIIDQVSETEVRIRKADAIPPLEVGFTEETAIVLSNRDRDRFLELLDHPPEPNAALRKLMAGKAEKRV
jgi:hypothetical protein